MGKIDADAPSAVSTGAAGFVVVGGVGGSTRHACEEAPSPAPPSSPMAPPTPTRRFEGFKKIRFLKKNAEGSSDGSVRNGVDLPSSKMNSKTNSTTASALADNDGARPSSSSSSNSSSPPAAVPANAKELRDHVAKFTTRSDRLGALVVAETAVGWLLTAAAPTLFDRYFAARRRLSSSSSTTPTTPSSAFFAALPALLFFLAWGALRACSYVRTVILMHDLVHGVVFTSRRANAIAATVSGLCAWTSAANFGRNHRRHHARLGVEEEIDFDADHTVFWTVKEWSAWRPSASKVLARVLRDPLVYHFVTAPGYLLFFGSTCPGYGPGLTASQTFRRLLRDHWPRIIGVVGGFSSIAAFAGVLRFQLELSAGWAALIVGAAIFGLQHDAVAPPLQGYRAPAAEHSRDAAALAGSTYIPLPRWLSDRVFLGIEHHHIHHLDARVPCYNLYECHASAPEGAWEKAGVPVLKGWGDIKRGLSMALWDEEKKQYAAFPPLVKRGQALEAWQRVVSVARERLHG